MNKKYMIYLRSIYYILITPLVLLIAPLYKLTRYILSRKNTKVVYKDILEGFANYTFPNEHIERLAITRAEICSKCPMAKYSGAVNTITVGEKISSIKGMYCDACGCGLSAKIRVPKNFCPKGKW